MRGFLTASLLILVAFLGSIPAAFAQQNPIYGRTNNGCVPIPNYTYMLGQPAPALIDLNTGALCTTGAGSGGSPTPVVPGQLTFLGQQKISAATIAASTALTVPAGAIIADFFPECAVAGTDNQCVRYNPGGASDSSAGSGLASQQLLLQYSGGLATIQFILAAGATGAAGTIPTLTINYYK